VGCHSGVRVYDHRKQVCDGIVYMDSNTVDDWVNEVYCLQGVIKSVD
jgi:hypothetical protein